MRLAQADIAFMLRVLDLSEEMRSKLEKVASGEAKLTVDEADELRDLCGERLQTHGFGPNYEPTQEGVQLERLIDELFVG
jgi:hypothetical protein